MTSETPRESISIFNTYVLGQTIGPDLIGSRSLWTYEIRGRLFCSTAIHGVELRGTRWMSGVPRFAVLRGILAEVGRTRVAAYRDKCLTGSNALLNALLNIPFTVLAVGIASKKYYASQQGRKTRSMDIP